MSARGVMAERFKARREIEAVRRDANAALAKVLGKAEDAMAFGRKHRAERVRTGLWGVLFGVSVTPGAVMLFELLRRVLS